MKKLFKQIVIPFLSLALITGCSNFNSDNWHYSKKDAADFDVFIANLKQKENESYLTYTVQTTAGTFTDKIDENKVVFFNKHNLDRDIKDSYYSYNEIKENEVKYNTITFNPDGSGFAVSFDGHLDCEYGALIRKDACTNNNFTFTYNEVVNLGEQNEVQTEFEERLISSHPGWNDLKTIVTIAGFVAQMYLGKTGKVATAVAAGAFGLGTTLGDTFFGSNGPSIADVLEKLSVVEAKLDKISDKIDANQRQIMDEFVRTQAMIDQVLANQYKAEITSFQTDYVEPIEDYLTIYKDFSETYFKQFVQQPREVEFYYSTSASGEHTLESKYDVNAPASSKYTLQINDWSNSLKHLKETKNIVDDEFPTAFLDDIKANITSMSTYPSGMLKEDLAQDIYLSIVNDINAKRFKDAANHNEILNFMTNVKKLASRISGSGNSSIADSYIARLKMMFNFAGEAYETILGTLSSLRSMLDNYMNLAQLACDFAEINSKDMGEAYLEATEKIESLLNAEKFFDKHYCYYTKNNVYGNFFNSYWNVGYTDLGNHPTFKSSFKTGLVTGFADFKAVSKEVNIQELGMIGEADNKRICGRYNMLRSLGLTDATSYIKYLEKVNVLSPDANNIYTLLKQHGLADRNDNRILTSFAMRDLEEKDYGMHLHCMAYGNPDSDYFSVGESTYYGDASGDRESKYYSGKMAYGTFLNADDCSVLKDNIVGAYAQYHESHKLWIDDEIFAFVDSYHGHFYFMLYTNPIYGHEA